VRNLLLDGVASSPFEKREAEVPVDDNHCSMGKTGRPAKGSGGQELVGINMPLRIFDGMQLVAITAGNVIGQISF
jgi:hypothetical protein